MDLDDIKLKFASPPPLPQILDFCMFAFYYFKVPAIFQ